MVAPPSLMLSMLAFTISNKPQYLAALHQILVKYKFILFIEWLQLVRQLSQPYTDQEYPAYR